MDGEENLRAEGFIEVSRKKGHLRAALGSDKLDSDYDSVNCVTPQGNMGYTTASVGDHPVTFFCSITARNLGVLLGISGNHNRGKDPTLARRANRVRNDRMTRERADILIGNALGAGTGGDEGNNGR